MWVICGVKLVGYSGQTVPNRARPRRRELLLRIYSQEIWIIGVDALTIEWGNLDIGRSFSSREIKAQRESNRELPGGK